MTWSKFALLVSLTALAYAQAPSSKEIESVYPDAHTSISTCIRTPNSPGTKRKPPPN